MIKLAKLNKKEKLLFFYCFFNVFTVFVIGVNLSFYFFPFLLAEYYKSSRSFIRLIKIEQLFALSFCLAAFLSSFSTLFISGKGDFFSALRVLPNYAYWSLIIIFFVSHYKTLRLDIIFFGIFYGLIGDIIYFIILQNLGFNKLPFLKTLTNNTFAYLLICFTPFAMYVVNKYYSKTHFYIICILLVFASLISGSRSSSILVFLSVSAYIFFKNFNYKVLLAFLLIIFISIPTINSPLVRSFVESINPRLNLIIYYPDLVFKLDSSYLVRVAQVKKGLEIYNRFPVFGVGLNNFEKYNIDFPLDFDGAFKIKGKKFTYNASSHNSYIKLLAEGGITLFLSYLFIIFSPFLRICYSAFKYRYFSEMHFCILLSLVTVSIHLYFITAVINVFSWFLFASIILVSFRKPNLKI